MAKWKAKYGKNHPTKAGQFRSSRGIKQDRKSASSEAWEAGRELDRANTKFVKTTKRLGGKELATSSERLNKIKPINYKGFTNVGYGKHKIKHFK